MPRNMSASFRKQINTTSATQPVLELVELHHPRMTDVVRIVNDVADLVHDGSTYTAFPFALSLPDETDGQMSKATLTISNGGRDLVDEVDGLNGLEGGTVRLMLYNKATDSVELSFEMGVTSCSMDVSHISIGLGYEDLLHYPAVGRTRRPENQPGIF